MHSFRGGEPTNRWFGERAPCWRANLRWKIDRDRYHRRAARGLAMNLFTRAVASTTGGHEARGSPWSKPDWSRHATTAGPGSGRQRCRGSAGLGDIPGPDRARAGSGVAAASRRPAHYGFSAAVGVCYIVLAQRVPSLRAGFGGLYGALVWAAADEGAMPALGLSRGPRALTPGLHLYSLFGHWVYGATLEAVRRAGRHRQELQSN